MNKTNPDEFIPKELDDAIYNSMLTTPGKWTVSMMRYRCKKRYILANIIKQIYVEECNAYWDWEEQMYWGYSVSERIMEIVKARINDFRKVEALNEEKRKREHLQTIISTI